MKFRKLIECFKKHDKGSAAPIVPIPGGQIWNSAQSADYYDNVIESINNALPYCKDQTITVVCQDFALTEGTVAFTEGSRIHFIRNRYFFNDVPVIGVCWFRWVRSDEASDFRT